MCIIWFLVGFVCLYACVYVRILVCVLDLPGAGAQALKSIFVKLHDLADWWTDCQW